MRKLGNVLQLTRAPQGTAGDVLWMAIAAFALVAQRLGVSYLAVDGIQGDVRRWLFLIPGLLIVVLAARFYKYVGAYVIAAGILLNLLPMAAHGGLMPIAYDTVMATGGEDRFTEADIGKPISGSKDTLERREDIHFEKLSDRYVLGLPGEDVLVYSAGDVVELVGLGLVAIQAFAMVLIPVAPDRRDDLAAEGDSG